MKKIILPKIEFEEKGDIKNFQLSEIKVIQKEGVRTFLSFIPFPIEVLASTDFTSSEIDRVIVSINRGELPTYNRKQANVFSQDRKDLDNILKETVIEAASKRLDFLSTDELKIFLDGVLEHARTGKCLLLGEDKCEACIVIKNIEFNQGLATLVSWVWVSSDVNLEKREELQNHLFDFLRQYGLETIIASIDIRNSRSQALFKRFNFQVRCLCVQPL